MAKFRSKVTEVEAEQFDSGRSPLPFSPDPICMLDQGGWHVETIHGQRTPIADGDWIIREPPNSANPFAAYPCKPDIFEARYEPVD